MSPTPAWWRREATRFTHAQIASAMATVVDWSLLLTLIAVGVFYVVASVTGAVVGGFFDFWLKKHYVFRPPKGGWHHQLWRYATVSGLSAGLNGLLAYGLVDGLGIPKAPGVILASGVIGVAWNYPLHRWFVFATRAAPIERAR